MIYSSLIWGSCAFLTLTFPTWFRSSNRDNFKEQKISFQIGIQHNLAPSQKKVMAKPRNCFFLPLPTNAAINRFQKLPMNCLLFIGEIISCFLQNCFYSVTLEGFPVWTTWCHVTHLHRILVQRTTKTLFGPSSGKLIDLLCIIVLLCCPSVVELNSTNW